MKKILILLLLMVASSVFAHPCQKSLFQTHKAGIAQIKLAQNLIKENSVNALERIGAQYDEKDLKIDFKFSVSTFLGIPGYGVYSVKVVTKNGTTLRTKIHEGGAANSNYKHNIYKFNMHDSLGNFIGYKCYLESKIYSTSLINSKTRVKVGEIMVDDKEPRVILESLIEIYN